MFHIIYKPFKPPRTPMPNKQLCLELYDNEEDALTEASTVVGCDHDLGDSTQRSLQRVHWLVVHSGSSRLSIASLRESGLAADGCHSTLDKDGTIVSYIHLSSRCRQTALLRHLNQGCCTARIVESVNDKTLASTPEFLLLVQHLHENDGRVVLDGSAFGLLSKHIGKKPSRLEVENAELRQRIEGMERERVLMEQRLQDALQDRSRMEVEMGSLRLALSQADGERSERESELKRLRIENTEFRRLGAEEKEVRRLNRELLTLRDDLDAKSQDCRVLECMLRIAREDNAKLREIASNAPRPRNYS